MNGSDPFKNGAVPFIEEQLFEHQKSPYRKFPDAEIGDLRMTGAFLSHLGNMPEKKVLRKYLKLAPAYQQALAFVFDTGWPAVDLEELFRGTVCPDGSYFKGAEVLAKMACEKICGTVTLDPLNMRNGLVTHKSIDDLFDSTEDLPALMTQLIGQMSKDLEESSQNLQGEEKEFLESLILKMQKEGIGSDRSDLREKIQLIYARLKQADWKAEKIKCLLQKNTSASSPPEPPTSEKNSVDQEHPVSEEKSTASKASPLRTFLSAKKPPPDVQGQDIAMLRLAETLWTETLFRKLNPLLKEDLYLLFHPRVLLKALYFLNPDQRKLLLSLEKKDWEIATELHITSARIKAERKKCFQKLATAIGDMRAYIFSIGGLPAASVGFHDPDLDSRKKAKPKPKKDPTKALRKKLLARIPRSLRPGPGQLPPNEDLFFKGPVRKMPRWLKCITRQEAKNAKDVVSGWTKKFLDDVLGIESAVPKEVWTNAFNELSGSEKDVVRFCGKGGSFAAFSREYYGSAPSARDAFKRAQNKLFEILAVL